MGNFQIGAYCERLEVTPKGEFRIVHDGGGVSAVSSNVKKLSPKQAQVYFEKHW